MALVSPKHRRLVIQIPDKTQRVKPLGVLGPKQFEGIAWGDQVTLGGESYHVLPARIQDHLAALERKAQIILPKDAAFLALATGVGPGSRVLEAGVGSGGLTLVLAHLVGPKGRVVGFDRRPEHLEVARRNLERAGLAGHVDLHEGDVVDAAPARCDAVVLDVPDPERIVPVLPAHVVPGAGVAVYTPLVSQVEAARGALHVHGFLDIQTIELLERRWVTRTEGSRPDTTMLGHTGFLTSARWPGR